MSLKACIRVLGSAKKNISDDRAPQRCTLNMRTIREYQFPYSGEVNVNTIIDVVNKVRISVVFLSL